MMLSKRREYEISSYSQVILAHPQGRAPVIGGANCAGLRLQVALGNVPCAILSMNVGEQQKGYFPILALRQT
jgi:hypothetical protein